MYNKYMFYTRTGMKKILLIVVIIIFTVALVACSSRNLSGDEQNSSLVQSNTIEKNTQEPVVSNTSNPTATTSNREKTEAEKQAEEYEKIAEEALKKEHDHSWVFSHFQERHPHTPEYKCSCGAVKVGGSDRAKYTMKIIGVSDNHPHYMLEKCSICNEVYANENLPSKIKWILDGYTEVHPHHGIVKCSRCDYFEINRAITSRGAGVSKLIVVGAKEEHPHHLIIECTYKGCEHSYIEKNAIAEWSVKTDANNYGIAHPHFLFGTCSYGSCSYSEKTNKIAQWDWDDGICSICGGTKDVLYEKMGSRIKITSAIDSNFQGHLHIPSVIEGLSVKDIGENAFAEQNLMLSIHIPDSIETIGTSAFANCILLKKIVFGPNLRLIDSFAFAGCIELEHITFASMVAPQIFPGTFAGISHELKIYVPVTSVGYDSQEWEQFEIIFLDFEEH